MFTKIPTNKLKSNMRSNFDLMYITSNVHCIDDEKRSLWKTNMSFCLLGLKNVLCLHVFQRLTSTTQFKKIVH